MTPFDLRSAREDESDFIFNAYKTTLQQYVDWAWGWDEDFQRSDFWKNHPLEQFRVVTVDGEGVGAIHTEEQETLLFVRLIFLLPAAQRRGIGSALIMREAARADADAKHLHLKVIKINPAKSLYDRLGFVTINEDNATWHMRLA